jgi:hypothetical protein
MLTSRKLEAKWKQFLQGRVSTRAKEDESSTVRVWGAEFHHVTARFRLAGGLKRTKLLILIFPIFVLAAVNR